MDINRWIVGCGFVEPQTNRNYFWESLLLVVETGMIQLSLYPSAAIGRFTYQYDHEIGVTQLFFDHPDVFLPGQHVQVQIHVLAKRLQVRFESHSDLIIYCYITLVANENTRRLLWRLKNLDHRVNSLGVCTGVRIRVRSG